jgi:hypothetical protein
MIAQTEKADPKVFAIAMKLIAKAGIELPKDGFRYTLEELNAALDKTTLPGQHRIEVKVAVDRAGLLHASAPVSAASGPSPRALEGARMVCEGLGLTMPAPGRKLSVGVVDDALASRGFTIDERFRKKAVLSAAGYL